VVVADTGVASSSFLDIDVAFLDVINNTSGNIRIFEFSPINDGFTINNLDQFSTGAVLINIDGPLVIADGVASTEGEAGLDDSGGGLYARGAVNLTAGGTIQCATVGTPCIGVAQAKDSLGPGDFGLLTVRAGSGTVLSGFIARVGDPDNPGPVGSGNLSAASAVRVNGGSCSFNGVDCLNTGTVVSGDPLDLFDPAQFLPNPPRTDTSTNSLDNTPAEAAFNNDPLEGAYAVDVFGTEFELVETAGGAEAAYTGLNYVFQDFWEFLEEGEGGEAAADEECREGEEAVDGECV